VASDPDFTLECEEPLSAVSRWVWVTFFAFVVVPLYAAAVALSIRSGLFDLKAPAPTNEQLNTVWAFVASGLATSATLAGLLFTKSHSDRTVAFQRDAEDRKHALEAETNERLKLALGT